MYASVSEICLSLQLSVKVKGCVCFALEKISSEIQTENETYGYIWSTWICFAKPTSLKPTRLSVLERDLMLCGASASTPCPSICMQVTTMASCIELDLKFILFCMHVISLSFWIELNLIFTFFCMQVITMCSVMSWTLYSHSSACRWPPWRSGGIWSSTSYACRWPSWSFG